MKELLERLAELIGLCDRKNRELEVLNSNAKKLTEELQYQRNVLSERERDLDTRETRIVTGELALRQAEETRQRLTTTCFNKSRANPASGRAKRFCRLPGERGR